MNATDLDASSTDNCTIAAFSLSKTEFSCADLGENTVTLTVTDGSGNKSSASATVTIRDTTPPTIDALSIYTLTLDAGSGQASLQAADLLNNVTDNCGAPATTIDKTSFNCSDVGTVNVTLTSRDDSGNEAKAVISVTVQETAPPTIGANQVFTIEENTANAALIGSVQASDNCGIATYTIADGNSSGAFALDNAGQLTVADGSQLNFEAITSCILSLQVADATGNISSESITINISNQNEAPIVVADISTLQTTNEDQAYSYSVPNTAFTDIDAGDVLVYSATGLPSWLSFNATTATLNGTPQNSDVGSYTITIRATDSEGLFAEQNFILEVINSNDAPTGISLSNNTIAENLPAGTTVGSFSSQDIDVPVNSAETATYSLVAGSGDTDNNKFAIEGSALLTTQPLDYDAQPNYSIRVQVTDAAGASFQQVFTIELTDEPDARAFLPTLFSPNNDGNNDRFILRGGLNGTSDFTFTIFNRDGKQVYQTTDLNQATSQGWDGNYQNEAQPQGAYIWIIQGIYADGKPITIEGRDTGIIRLVR